jgi:hypothetical protein
MAINPDEKNDRLLSKFKVTLIFSNFLISTFTHLSKDFFIELTHSFHQYISVNYANKMTILNHQQTPIQTSNNNDDAIQKKGSALC